MAVTVYPTGVTDNWVQIATSTPTSGSTVSFTSIPSSYRKLWVTNKGAKMTLSSTGFLYIQVNSITGADTYIYYHQTTTQTVITDEPGIYSFPAAAATTPTLNIILTNKRSGTPFATFEGQGSGGNGAIQIWAGLIPTATTAITQIDVTTSTTFVGNTAALTLYGTY